MALNDRGVDRPEFRIGCNNSQFVHRLTFGIFRTACFHPLPLVIHAGFELYTRVRFQLVIGLRGELLLTLPTAKAGGFSFQRPLRRSCVLHGLHERIGLGVSRPTACLG